MNEHLRRIDELDRQTAQLQKLIDDGEWNAAGISVTIGVGANFDNPVCNMALCFNADNVLAATFEGLAQARAFRVKCLESEFGEISKFLTSEKEKA